MRRVPLKRNTKPQKEKGGRGTMEQEAKEESLRLIDFIGRSHSAFHAVENMAQMLKAQGFRELTMGMPWDVADLEPCYIKYNGTALVAFCVCGSMADKGLRIVASHSDSPTFRVKPNGMRTGSGKAIKLATETYGGAILSTWMDRPLSLAGRVIVEGSDALHPEQHLVDMGRPLGVIPSVAIHFNRGVNENASFNKEIDMPILAGVGNEDEFADGLIREIGSQLGVERERILDFDLYAYDTRPGTLAGFNDSLVVCPKQDNLTMAYESVQAMLASQERSGGNVTNRMIVVLDNEEVGSGTKQGAASALVRDVIRRLTESWGLGEEGYQRTIYNSFLVSADMAHAVHPNHPEYSDLTNRPVLNGGPVIKYNAQQKYMTDADGAAVFRKVCELAGVPCQTFVNRSDMAGGSTLGNIMTCHLPMRGVDVGNPMLAMHSCCETGGTLDARYLGLALEMFLNI